ncbi:MAG: thiamine pyrophosphate-binding protein [Desulfobacteraceae bacterium]|nr:MAG: thiamine pyrophosphate-binding protein [Desulfobacteraceae bacterium]
MKLSDYVAEFIAGLGIRHVFMLPGGFAMHLNDSIGRCSSLTFICNLHEQACAIAAEAYARVTNEIGVAMVTAGPGGTNAITGLAAAWLDSTPCLFLSGQAKRADISGNLGVRQLGIQELDIVSIVRPITKYAVTVIDPDSIRYHLEKGVYLARTGRPGPVWIDIPLDVQAATIDPQNLQGFRPEQKGSSAAGDNLKEFAEETIRLLSGASRPVILAGNGVRLSRAQDSFLKLVDRLGIPVLTTRLGVDLIPSSHPLSFGIPGSIASRGANFTLQNSDWLLILGARLDRALVAFAPERLARAAKKIMVDIDAAEIGKLTPYIDIPVHSDVHSFIRLLLDSPGTKAKDCSGWTDRCSQWKVRYPFVLPEHFSSRDGISVYAFADILSSLLEEGDVILPGNAGNASEIFLTAFKVKAGQRVFHNKGTGAMGFSQPAAIGACLASGGKRTVCVDGDGGFQLNVQELETIRRLNLPIKFFVMNNGGYASIRASQMGSFGRTTAADATSGMTLPSILNQAASYGIPSFRIDNPGHLKEGIEKVLNGGGPGICEVLVIRDEIRSPRVSTIQHADGSISSKPLEDMWPFLDREEFLSNMLIEPLK